MFKVVANNCLKLSGFGVDITKFSLPQEITRKFCGRKFLPPKNSFAGF